MFERSSDANKREVKREKTERIEDKRVARVMVIEMQGSWLSAALLDAVNSNVHRVHRQCIIVIRLSLNCGAGQVHAVYIAICRSMVCKRKWRVTLSSWRNRPLLSHTLSLSEVRRKFAEWSMLLLKILAVMESQQHAETNKDSAI